MSLTRPPQVNSKNFGDKPVLTKSLSDRLNPPSPADGRGSARESVAPFLTVDIVSSTMSCRLTPVETASSMLLCCGEPAVFDACGVASELVFGGFRRPVSRFWHRWRGRANVLEASEGSIRYWHILATCARGAWGNLRHINATSRGQVPKGGPLLPRSFHGEPLVLTLAAWLQSYIVF